MKSRIALILRMAFAIPATRTRFRLALFTLVVLCAAAPARAAFIYSFNSTVPAVPQLGPFGGFFRVPDAAIADGLITDDEITTFEFLDGGFTFGSGDIPGAGGVIQDANIPVDSMTGLMTGPGGIILSGNQGMPDQQLATLFSGPDDVLQYIRTSGDQSGTGAGSWLVTPAPEEAPVPEPSSLTMVLVGIATWAGVALAPRQRCARRPD